MPNNSRVSEKTTVTDGMFRRALDHERALLYGAATRVVKTDFGSIVINTDFPSALSHNFAYVDRAVSPDALLAEMDRVFEDSGITFRVIEISNSRLLDDFEPVLGQAKFERSSDVLMALTDVPERKANVQADIVTFEEIRPSIEAAWRRSGMSAAGAQGLAKRATTFFEYCDICYAAVRQGDAHVSSCVQYIRSTTAQIDEVITDPSWQGRGYATAVIAAAAAYARDQGCDFVFLRTDANDWPQQLYRRLGFRVIGRTFGFERAED